MIKLVRVSLQMFYMISFPKKLITVTAGATLSLAAIITNSPTASSVTLESATLGSLSGLPGYSIDDYQFLGWRFQINETLQVRNIGGHFAGYADREIFGAIAPLSDLTALPQGIPEDLEELSLAATTFSVPSNDNDPNTSSVVLLTPLSVTLTPGYYALIFGSGLFGASGSDAMPFPESQQDFPNSSYFFASTSGVGLATTWRNGGISDVYFVVEGESISSTQVPEPSSTFGLFALGVLGTASILRRRCMILS